MLIIINKNCKSNQNAIPLSVLEWLVPKQQKVIIGKDTEKMEVLGTFGGNEKWWTTVQNSTGAPQKPKTWIAAGDIAQQHCVCLGSKRLRVQFLIQKNQMTIWSNYSTSIYSPKELKASSQIFRHPCSGNTIHKINSLKPVGYINK